MYTLGKYRKSINEEQKSKYQNYLEAIFKKLLKQVVDYTNQELMLSHKKKLMINIQ